MDLVRTVPKLHGSQAGYKRDLLWKTVEESSEDLTPTEKDKLFQLLLEYGDIFAENASDLGHATKICHQIHTEGAPPVQQQVR